VIDTEDIGRWSEDDDSGVERRHPESPGHVSVACSSGYSGALEVKNSSGRHWGSWGAVSGVASGCRRRNRPPRRRNSDRILISSWARRFRAAGV
jgi:hypothetical protein